MTLTPEQLDELEAKAKAATPGPWTSRKHGSMGPEHYVLSGPNLCTDVGMQEDVEHIAANSPDVTLHLVSVYRAALAWNEARAEFASRQTLSTLKSLDVAGDALHEALRGAP